MSAAKWHARRAQDFREDADSAERNVRRNDSAEWAETCARDAEACIERAAHHYLAATVLEALAVPGVAESLIYRAHTVDDLNPSAVRAALRTIADAAKEAK
jgi:hypothetical protein